MHSNLIIQHETLRFRELVSTIKTDTIPDDERTTVASHLLELMAKYNASNQIFYKMVNLLMENTETIFPFLVLYSNDELLKVLSGSRAGKPMFEHGLKGILKRKFENLNQVETIFILYLEYYCNCCLSRLTGQKADGKISKTTDRIDELKTLIAGIRGTFEKVSDSELTIDKATRMIQSICEDITNTDKDIEDILTGKGRLTLCTTKDSREARNSAELEKMEYIVKNGELIFYMRIGIDVNMEVEATPKMLSLLRKYNIEFVENNETTKYVLDFHKYKNPADFTFEQMMSLKPSRNYFPKAINCNEKTVIPEGTFAKVVAYDGSGRMQTYRLPLPVRTK